MSFHTLPASDDEDEDEDMEVTVTFGADGGMTISGISDSVELNERQLRHLHRLIHQELPSVRSILRERGLA